MLQLLILLHVIIVIFPYQKNKIIQTYQYIKFPGLAGEMVNFYGLAGENTCYICENTFPHVVNHVISCHNIHNCNISVSIPWTGRWNGEFLYISIYILWTGRWKCSSHLWRRCCICGRMLQMLHMLHVIIVIFPYQIPGLASEMVNFYGLASENRCYMCYIYYICEKMKHVSCHNIHNCHICHVSISSPWTGQWISMDWPVMQCQKNKIK